MPRCANCYGVVTKEDDICYSCGDMVPKEIRDAMKVKQPIPISKFSNILFIASLGLTAFSFLSPFRLPLLISLSLSVLLFALRFLDPARKQAAKRAEPNIQSSQQG